MFVAILKATNNSFQKDTTFCRNIYVKKVMKLLAFIFEQPSYICYYGLPSKYNSTEQYSSGLRGRGNFLYMRGWTGGYPTPSSLPLSPHFPPPFTPLPSPSPPTSLPLQPHFPPPVRFFPPPDKILFLFMNLSVAKNQN